MTWGIILLSLENSEETGHWLSITETLPGCCPAPMIYSPLSSLQLRPAKCQLTANELNWKSAGEVVKLRTAAWSLLASGTNYSLYSDTRFYKFQLRVPSSLLSCWWEWSGLAICHLLLCSSGHCGHAETLCALGVPRRPQPFAPIINSEDKLSWCLF